MRRMVGGLTGGSLCKVTALALAALWVAAVFMLPSFTFAEDWPKYRRDLNNSGLSAETFLSSANVSSLALKWKYSPGGYISASPAVATVNGESMVFLGAWNGTFTALDAVTGALKWQFQIDAVTNCNQDSCTRIGSSAAVDSGMVYFGAANGYFYALNASTGALVWKIQEGDPNQGYEVWASPLIYRGIVYYGVASHTGVPCVQGRVIARVAATGAPIWTFSTLDQRTCPSGTCVGGDVWASPALDTQFGTLFVGTGNPGAAGCTPASADATLYPDSILALNPITGQLMNYFQSVPQDQLDQDFGSSPVLHQTEQYNFNSNAFSINYWVTEASKDHSVYTLPRGLGGLASTKAQAVNLQSQIIASPAVRPIIGYPAPGVMGIGNDIWVPTDGGTLAAIQQDTYGNTTLLGWITASASNSAPALINDLLFYGNNAGDLVAVTTQSTSTGLGGGTVVYTYVTGGPVWSGPAISNGRIYFGSTDTYVYCLSIGGN